MAIALRKSKRIEPSERRRYTRTTVLWSAEMVTRGSSIECAIINVSASGAMLQLPEAIECPPKVKLRNMLLGQWDAHITWRDGKRVGIEFDADPEDVAVTLGRVLS